MTHNDPLCPSLAAAAAAAAHPVAGVHDLVAANNPLAAAEDAALPVASVHGVVAASDPLAAVALHVATVLEVVTANCPFVLTATLTVAAGEGHVPQSGFPLKDVICSVRQVHCPVMLCYWIVQTSTILSHFHSQLRTGQGEDGLDTLDLTGNCIVVDSCQI